jgi:hypothetical protein
MSKAITQTEAQTKQPDGAAKKQPLPEQLSDILLVLDKELMKIQAVKGIDKNGKLQTVSPTEKNQSEFMKVDRQGDIFSNFFSNFYRQLKNPSRFSFFKVAAAEVVDTVAAMQKQLKTPTPKGEELLLKHEVKTDAKQGQEEKPKQQAQENLQQKNQAQSVPEKNQNSQPKNETDTPKTQTAAAAGEYRYKPEQIDWETMSNIGLSKEKLEKLNLLDPLLKGYKTNELVPVSLNFGGVITRTDARLSLQPAEDGSVIVAIHGIRKEPQFNTPFFGHEFSKEDKDNLLTSGNMGRVVELTNPKTNDKIPSIISLDRLTNELIALRTEYIKIPDELKGVKLNDEQKQTLQEGKPLLIEGMTAKKGGLFDATVQYNADKRFVEFLFDRSLGNAQTKNNAQIQEAPRTVRGKTFSDDEYKKFKEGQTIYAKNLVDKKGIIYNGYLTFDKKTGKTGFSFTSPNKLKEKIQPAQEQTTTPTKSKGRKM